MTQPPNFITLDKWRELGSVLDFGGHQIFALSVGQGQSLLCLHGFPTASFDYFHLVPLLADSFQVIP